MYDRTVSEVQRVSLMKEIVTTATLDKILADEVYVQTMKQLTGNPSARSKVQGWKLMLALCQEVCPSQGLHDFVHVFLMKAMKLEQGNSDIIGMIRQAVTDLNMTAAPDKHDANT